MQLKIGSKFIKKLKYYVNFFQHIYHTGHQNSKWKENETFFGVLHRSL